MSHGVQKTCLTSSQWLPEREDHMTVVEGGAYKVRYRPGAGKLRNGQVCIVVHFLPVSKACVSACSKESHQSNTNINP